MQQPQYPREALQFVACIPGDICLDNQHLTYTSTSLRVKTFNISILRFTMFLGREGESDPVPLMIISEFNRWVMLPQN